MYLMGKYTLNICQIIKLKKRIQKLCIINPISEEMIYARKLYYLKIRLFYIDISNSSIEILI